MINLKNKAKINWSEIKISIIGAGISGIAAAKLGKYLGANIFISDCNEVSETIEKIHKFDLCLTFIPFEEVPPN